MKRIVVGSQRLGHHKEREGKGREYPEITADASGAARSLISRENAKGAHNELHQVGEERSGGERSPFQENRGMKNQQDTSRYERVAREGPHGHLFSLVLHSGPC